MRGKHSTVVLFVHGLPTDVSNKELKGFIRTTLKASGLKTQIMLSDLVGDCNILRITDPETGQIEFHGLIEIRPAALAMRAIEILNETEFRGNPLITYRYRQRSPLERRQGSVNDTRIDRPEKQQAPEQRRPALKIDLVERDTVGSLLVRTFGANHRFARR